jgi:hypothetical protein
MAKFTKQIRKADGSLTDDSEFTMSMGEITSISATVFVRGMWVGVIAGAVLGGVVGVLLTRVYQVWVA